MTVMSTFDATRRASKISVVGAGSVGSSLAYACLIRGSAGLVSLYDIAKDKVEAEVADLAHGTQFTPASVMGGADVHDTADSDVVFITAGARQKPGQTRLDLAGVNANILRSLMPQLVEQSPNALFVLVTNPCDVLTVVAQEATGLPRQPCFFHRYDARHLAAALAHPSVGQRRAASCPCHHCGRARRLGVSAVVDSQYLRCTDPRLGS